MYNRFTKINASGNLVMSGNESRRISICAYNAFMNFMSAMVSGGNPDEHKLALKNCIENLMEKDSADEVIDSERLVWILAFRAGSYSATNGQFKCLALSSFKKVLADPKTYLNAGMSNYAQIEVPELKEKKSSGKKSAQQKLLEELGCTLEELKQAIAQAKSQAQVA